MMRSMNCPLCAALGSETLIEVDIDGCICDPEGMQHMRTHRIEIEVGHGFRCPVCGYHPQAILPHLKAHSEKELAMVILGT